MRNKDLIMISGLLLASSVLAGFAKPESLNSFEPVKENVKIYGRTAYDDGSLWLGLSGTGIGFTFTGTKVEIDVHPDEAPASEDEGERLLLYADGEVKQDVILSGRRAQTIKAGLADGTHTIRLIKASECQHGTAKIDVIRTDSKKISPEKKGDHTIEFIGDSITCGYAVESVDTDDGFALSQENVTKTYAFRTAEHFNADASFVAYSGYGVISGYTSNPSKRDDGRQMKDFYERTGHCSAKMDGKSIDRIKWEFREDPELIVINLGTNDSFYFEDDAKKRDEFVEGYVNLLKLVHEKNPSSYILVADGFYGKDIHELTKRAAKEYAKETKDERISSYLLRPVDKKKDGEAGDGHPTQVSHDKAVPGLVFKIVQVMGW
ncbi:MAG: GDSL family lipase [Lachnospiraceae bacterium]|nr:GDSL family lipase [Lachnospiraceae bacterium]